MIVFEIFREAMWNLWVQLWTQSHGLSRNMLISRTEAESAAFESCFSVCVCFSAGFSAQLDI